jgi:hypothetical protein
MSLFSLTRGLCKDRQELPWSCPHSWCWFPLLTSSVGPSGVSCRGPSAQEPFLTWRLSTALPANTLNNEFGDNNL